MGQICEAFEQILNLLMKTVQCPMRTKGNSAKCCNTVIYIVKPAFCNKIVLDFGLNTYFSGKISQVRITKNQARLYHYLKNDYIQHFLYGCGVFVLIFFAFVFHAWYYGKVDPDPNVRYRFNALTLIFKEAMIYTFFMAMPVYFNLFLFLLYRGRIDKIMDWKMFPRPELKGWGFPLFMLLSSIIALLFAFPATTLFHRILTIIPAPWYNVFIAAELLTLISTGAVYTKETIEINRELERKSRMEDIRRRREADKRRQEVEKELTFIKKQIRPHFLFNTLQNLKILALKKSDDLPVLMDQLSLLLRYLFTEANKKLVSVEKEIEFIKGYVELERLSLSENTRLTFEVKGFQSEVETSQIAPMLLLNVVENCFKHYNKSNLGEKRIEINIRSEKDIITLSTLNTFEKGVRNEHPLVESDGVGLKTLSENLTLIYGTQYVLETKTESPYFIVHLQIPLL